MMVIQALFKHPCYRCI